MSDISDLEKAYKGLLDKTIKSNIFHSIIRNNRDLRNELYSKAAEIRELYEDPSDLQLISFVFREKQIQYCKCGSPRSWRNLTKGYNKTCGNKNCVNTQNKESVKEYNLATYGTEHYFQTDEFKEKFKKTSLERFGTDNPARSKEVINKIKETNLERFGETSWLKVQGNAQIIKDAITCRFELERMEKIKDLKLPIKIINLKSGEFIEFLCESCQNSQKSSNSFFNKRIKIGETPCRICNPPLVSTSNGEMELFNFISDIYKGEIQRNNRTICEGKEIDIFLPELNMGFEFDGIYWHSEYFKEKWDNINKKNFIQSKGIKLYNVWEDDWLYKKDIIKSRIINSLGLSNKIHARKCEVKEIKTGQKIFLDENHIQGYVPAQISIGLYYENELISVMTLGAKRKLVSDKQKQGHYELLRFCNKIGYSIIGGASKLFTYFLKKYDPENITSYQDNSWYTGNIYEKLGFKLIKEAEPNYYWCKANIKYHRYNFRKSKLIEEGFNKDLNETEIMNQRGYYKLWGFGSLKWEYNKKAY